MNTEYGEEDYKGKILPKKAVKMLKEEGMETKLDQAEEIIYFLRKLANIQTKHFSERNVN
jgi:hypothetical protein